MSLPSISIFHSALPILMGMLLVASPKLHAEEPATPDSPVATESSDPTLPPPSLTEIMRAMDSESGKLTTAKPVQWQLVARIVSVEGAIAIIAADKHHFTIREGDAVLHDGNIFQVDTLNKEAVILLETSNGNSIILR